MGSSALDLFSIDLEGKEALTVQEILDEIIPCLVTHFSGLKSSIPRRSLSAPPGPDSTDPKIEGLGRQVIPEPTKKTGLKSNGRNRNRNRNRTKTKNGKNGDGNNNSSSHSDVPYDEAQLCEQLDGLQRDLSYISEELDRLKKTEVSVGGLVKALVEHCIKEFQGLKQSQEQAVDPSSGGNAATQLNPMLIKLSRVTHIISRLKLQIPIPHRILSASSDAHR